jgi:choline dehydrogenase-like flavoprotein
MQCAAVLLLEMGYQTRHVKDNNASITADIQKLINWLHAMQHNDPVAARAHHVVRRILQNVAPILQDKAAELLDEGLATSVSNAQTSGFLDTSRGGRNTGVDWAQVNLVDGSASVSGHQYYPHSADQDYFGTAQASQGHPTYGNYSLDDLQLSGTFGNPFINSWDEVIPLAGIQDQWHNTGTAAVNHEGDIEDMNFFPGSNEEQIHLQQPQDQQDYSQQNYQGQMAQWQNQQ